MGALLGRSIARPIQSLAGGMRRFSPRKELPEIAVHSRDEIGELAESFIAMADKLRANDKMQTDFLQNASHELKTPLMAIQGNAEAIKDGIVREREAEESLDVIIAQCQRLKTVVDELIYLTRVDHQPDAFRLERAAIGEIIGEAAASVRGLADQQGITIMVKGDVDSVGVFDREKLKRALINVIGNGIRYAQTRIIVQAIGKAGQLEIVCEDDGKGLAPGEEERIFDRFYKGEHGGTGIGLAITKAIVEAHGGSIAADAAKPAGGAVIRILLPLQR
jgi:signal transduction histidine kinase